MTDSLAASVAVRHLLRGPPRRLVRTVAVRRAVGFGPLAIAGVASTRPPHACLTTDRELLTRIARLPHLTVGGDRIVAGDTVCAVRRWWQPRPRPAHVPPEVLAARLPLLDGEVVAALRDHPRREAARLLGRGPGLTPSGDDVLVGFLAAAAVLGAAVPSGQDGRSLAAWVGRAAPRRTTDLSARLLLHATRGEVMAPVGAVLLALASGRGVACAGDRLRAVGASSGEALLAGIATGVASLVGRGRSGAADPRCRPGATTHRVDRLAATPAAGPGA